MWLWLKAQMLQAGAIYNPADTPWRDALYIYRCVPAVARLQGRQEAFAVRLAARREPADGLLEAGTGLGKRLRDMTEKGTEKIRASRGLVFPRSEEHTSELQSRP